MQKERHNFVYGNEEEGVRGCIANGIDERTANKIYDEMIDFAKYAFNKSHAAAYAVVTYETAYLKHYYSVEYFAALMTSVIDNLPKVSEYIREAKDLGIEILPPDINEGQWDFSVKGDSIRYGLSAIKSVGRSVIEAIVAEREAHGKFKSLQDFCKRMTTKEMNKRTVESLIKAGSFDSLGGSRKQYMQVYIRVIDQAVAEKKNNTPGQMTLFDFMPEEEKSKYEMKLPEVGEFDRQQLLAFEKEVMGIYVSGHPLEEYQEKMKKFITASTADFTIEEEKEEPHLEDNQYVTIGGMITALTIKGTKNNKTMAFLTLEDLLGTVEVVVFPNKYEQYRNLLEEDAKVFINGRVSLEEEQDGKLICDQIVRFEDTQKDIWVQFHDKESFLAYQQELLSALQLSDGKDEVVVYLKKERQIKRLGKRMSVKADEKLLNRLENLFGAGNIKVTERSLQ